MDFTEQAQNLIDKCESFVNNQLTREEYKEMCHLVDEVCDVILDGLAQISVQEGEIASPRATAHFVNHQMFLAGIQYAIQNEIR
jgi:hypothetical protein